MRMNLKDKVEILTNAYNSDEEFNKANELFSLAYNQDEQLYYIDFNLRDFIRQEIEKNNVSLKDICTLIGYNNSSFTSYLNGRRGLPYDKLEKVLGLIFTQPKDLKNIKNN
jgi:uncharacterized protein (UPF0371 family)